MGKRQFVIVQKTQNIFKSAFHLEKARSFRYNVKYEVMKRGTQVEQFGEKLSAARRAKGYTQEDLAEKLAVSRTNISRWESGKMTPDLDTVNRL